VLSGRDNRRVRSNGGMVSGMGKATNLAEGSVTMSALPPRISHEVSEGLNPRHSCLTVRPVCFPDSRYSLCRSDLYCQTLRINLETEM
jgi:hypothetical protein